MAALDQAKPDGIFNVLFGGDLTQFVREGDSRGLFEKRTVLSLLTGEPEWYLPLKRRGPGGLDRHRLSLGTDHGAEAQGVRRRLPGQIQRHAPARLAARLRHVHMIRDTLEKAGSTDTEALIKALEDARFDTVIGPVTMPGPRSSVEHGGVGRQACFERRLAAMTDWTYLDGAAFLPPAEEVKAVRKD